MEETLERELLRASRKQLSLGIILVDVDHIKRFNDTYGHAAGDELLRELGNSLYEHGRGEDMLWGISESGYLAFDPGMNYQYRAFGVPDLGIKRDAPEDLVVAPYASLLRLSLQPQAVLASITRLENLHKNSHTEPKPNNLWHRSCPRPGDPGR